MRGAGIGLAIRRALVLQVALGRLGEKHGAIGADDGDGRVVEGGGESDRVGHHWQVCGAGRPGQSRTVIASGEAKRRPESVPRSHARDPCLRTLPEMVGCKADQTLSAPSAAPISALASALAQSAGPCSSASSQPAGSTSRLTGMPSTLRAARSVLEDPGLRVGVIGQAADLLAWPARPSACRDCACRC